MTILIGLDIGTTGARAIAVDLAGAVVAQASHEYPLLSPRSGWMEQRPQDWWDATRQALGRLGAQVVSQVAGLGLTGQMHGAVVLDASDSVIRPALLWNDQRTEAQCIEITDLVGLDRLIGIAGNPALTGFQAPKLLWLREEEPESFARIARVLLPKDYVRLRLTGEYATDVSDASGTLLLDLRRRDWSRELLDGSYHLMGVTLSAGGSLRWWRDALGDGLTYDELTELADSAPPGAEGLLFLPHLAGERTPHLDPAARGAFFGLTARHRLGALANGAVGAAAAQLQDFSWMRRYPHRGFS